MKCKINGCPIARYCMQELSSKAYAPFELVGNNKNAVSCAHFIKKEVKYTPEYFKNIHYGKS